MSQPKVRVGTAYLLAAQGIFVISAYAMHIVLGRYLGPAEYGLFGVVLYAATMIRTFVGSGLPMAAARFVSSDPQRAEAIFRKSIVLQLALAMAVSLLFFLAAPALANLLGDEGLTPLFRLVAPITIFYGIFFLVVQYYNGLRRYGLQSAWLASSYLLRVGLVVGLAVVGFRVFGAVAGLVAATAIAGFLALATRRSVKYEEPFPASALIRFSAPLILASFGQAFLTDLDLMFVKKMVAGASSAGYYTSAKAMAQVTPFAFYALSSALYPAVSSAFSSGDQAGLRRYIQQANRLLLMVILPLFLIVSWDSEGIIGLLYGPEYLTGAPALRWLMLSFSLLAVFIIHKTIITGCGFPKVSCLLTLMLLPLCIALQITLIPIYGLIGAAIASALTFFIGANCSLIILLKKFKAGFQLYSSLRIIGAALLVFALDIVLTLLGLMLLPKLALLGAFYLIILRLSGEWRRGQLRDLVGHFMGWNESRGN